jgi:hypothetical protein
MNNKANFIKISMISGPSVNDCQYPMINGRSYTIVRRESRTLSSIITENDQGQTYNIFRATGTDQENLKRIRNALRVFGYKVDEDIPYIFEDGQLIDGYTRFDAIEQEGYSCWIFNVVQVRAGFTREDVAREIGLGKNNHWNAFKAATVTDWQKVIAARIDEMCEDDPHNMPTVGQIVDFINTIDHSFTQKKVATLAEECIAKKMSSLTMESFSTRSARKKAVTMLNEQGRGVRNLVVLNGSGDRTYIYRTIVEIMEKFYATGEVPDLVSFLQDVPAEEAEDMRREIAQKMDHFNGIIDAIVTARLEQGSSFKLFDLKGFLPQVIGVEEDIVSV